MRIKTGWVRWVNDFQGVGAPIYQRLWVLTSIAGGYCLSALYCRQQLNIMGYLYFETGL